MSVRKNGGRSELANRVLELTQSKSKIVFVNPKSIYGPLYEEANDKYPDADKATNELKWKPKKGIEITIKETYEYMKQMKKLKPEVFHILSGDLD